MGSIIRIYEQTTWMHVHDLSLFVFYFTKPDVHEQLRDERIQRDDCRVIRESMCIAR